MKGDITRHTFNPRNHYTSVRSQQGRVPLDAEANEAQDIQNYLDQITRRDTIGPCGVPMTGGGFAISLLATGSQQDLAISSGRIYVNGLLGELDTGQAIATQIQSATVLTVAANRLEGEPLEPGQWVEVWAEGIAPQRLRISSIAPEADSDPPTYALTVAPSITTPATQANRMLRRVSTVLFQPDYPEFSFPTVLPTQPSVLSTETGVYLAYLDLWQHHITALEDPNIKEIALGGPDTTTRTKTVCQVKLARVSEIEDDPTCANFTDWTPTPSASRRLMVRTVSDPLAESPCIVPVQAGYRRLENQLYRVEIHRGGTAGTATFKWSRDNGSLVTEWTGPDTANTSALSVASTGVDSVQRFFPNQWVEITDDTHELHNEPGPLIQVQTAVDQTLTVDGNVTRANFPRRPKVRAWDHQATVAKPTGAANIPLNLVEGAVPVHEGDWIELEDGVQVFFEPGGTYVSGDYWLVPARVIGGDVIWPRDDSGETLLEPPLGIEHHYCRLALLRRTATAWSDDITDCRPLFPPLTDLTNLQSCGEIAVRPDDNLQAVFDRIPAGGSAKLCFHPGSWNLTATIQVNNKGHLILTGAGAATRLTTSTVDCVLRFSECASVTVRDLAAQGGAAGAVGDGLQGTLSFLDCGAVTVEQVQASCNASLSRRASAIQVWTRSPQSPLADVRIINCRVNVGHGQIGILVVNGDRVTIAHNDVETPATPLVISEAIANPVFAANLGRSFMNRIQVGREFDDDAIMAVINRGDFGLSEPIEIVDQVPDAAGQIRLVGRMPQWGPFFFVFATDLLMSPTTWVDVLTANPLVPSANQRIRAGVVKTGLHRLRKRLVLQLFGDGREVNIPISATRVLSSIAARVRRNNPVIAGGQGIVVAGNRTPRFGVEESFANGLFILSGDRSPTALVNHNHVNGFAQGIHIGTSDATSRHYRSYHVEVASNTVMLRASSLSQERHGIFVGNAHTVKAQDNVVEVTIPNASSWTNPRSDQPRTSPPPTDGIYLHGFYGPLLHIKQNHCIGVTCGIRINARNAGNHEQAYDIVTSWLVANNAYAGVGRPEILRAHPAMRFSS
jgi:hypothetical protein